MGWFKDAGRKAVTMVAVGFAICAAPVGVGGSVALMRTLALPWWLSFLLFPLVSATAVVVFKVVAVGLYVAANGRMPGED